MADGAKYGSTCQIKEQILDQTEHKRITKKSLPAVSLDIQYKVLLMSDSKKAYSQRREGKMGETEAG